MPKSFKEWSKAHWSRTDEAPLTDEQIQIGCLQRIADATELMARNHLSLIEDRDKFERWYREERARREKLERSIIAHKANYTRVKNKLDAVNKTEWYQNHLPTCGTAFRGCDPDCPKEKMEKTLENESQNA